MKIKETKTYKRLSRKKQDNFPDKIIVHHTGGSDRNPMADTSHHTATQVEKWHMSKGWEGIGYTYFIQSNGIIYKGRPEKYHGAHTQGQNTKSIGICLAGNFDATLPTEKQTEALLGLVKDIMGRHNIDKRDIYPHRAFANKSCFGNKLNDNWVQKLLEKDSNPLAKFTTAELAKEILRRINPTS